MILPMNRLLKWAFNVCTLLSLALCVWLLHWRLYSYGHSVTVSWVASGSVNGGPLVVFGSGTGTRTIDQPVPFSNFWLTLTIAMFLPVLWIGRKLARKSR